jgi:hypothetical protein
MAVSGNHAPVSTHDRLQLSKLDYGTIYIEFTSPTAADRGVPNGLSVLPQSIGVGVGIGIGVDGVTESATTKSLDTDYDSDPDANV